MTLQTHSPAPDPGWIAELTAELESYGYKVTKPRAPRGTSTEPGRADGAVPVKAPRSGKASHDACAAHYRVPGLTRPVCVTREGTTYEGSAELVPADWTDTDTVLAFAVDVGARMADAGAVLRQLAERDAIARHAEHVPGQYGPAGSTYTGAPDCWRCEREYRNNAAGTAAPDARPSTDAGMLPDHLRHGRYDAEKDRKQDEARRMRKVPHTFAPRGGYQWADECDTCTGAKSADVHRTEDAEAVA